MNLEWEADGHTHSHRLTPEQPVTLGRDAACAVVLRHPTVSRQHADISAQGPVYYIRNLSRTNPVYLEHRGTVTRLDWGQHTVLPAGSRIRLGDMQLEVRDIVTLRVRCPGPCGRVIAMPPSGFCPYCGTALASGDTFPG